MSPPLQVLAGRLTERRRLAIVGALSAIVIVAVSTLGVKIATGAWEDRYEVTASFTAAGQGLIRESDVKIHGVTIGEVRSVELVDGRAKVTMSIDSDERIPARASATIRPKTLFGEKFVDIDPGPDESRGPFLGDGDRIVKTLGGFELERVLSDAYPILEAIDPDEVAVILSEMAAAARGMGPTINRTIANAAEVARVQAAHAADTSQFLSDLALLSEELAKRAPDLVAAAGDLNAALPDLNARGDQLRVVLEQAARLSADAADVLEANRPFLEKSVTQGGKTLQVLYDQRGQLPGLVRGLRYFAQVLSEITWYELDDGTRLAAVKAVLGGGSPCGRTAAACPPYTGPPAGASGGGGEHGQLPVPLPVPVPQEGAGSVTGIVEGMLR